MTNSSRALAVALVMLGVSAPMNTAMTAPKPQFSMQTGSVTSQPIGHYEFCKQHHAECAIRTKAAALPRLTPHGWDIVRDVNRDVNASITPMTDAEAFGREEVWSYPVDVGDCEDFVLLKRQKLIKAGFSAADLLITVVRKPDGEGHAVLTVRTDKGDYILDNLNDAVRPWEETGYRFLKRQAIDNTGRWVSIREGQPVLVGAVR